MNKTQISTSVSDETRRKADILVDEAGYTYRELVSIGIDRLYAEWQRSTMTVDYYDQNLRNHMVRSAVVVDGAVTVTFLWERGGDYRGEDVQSLTGKTIADLHALGFRKRADESEHPGYEDQPRHGTERSTMTRYNDSELYEMFVAHGTSAAEVRSLSLERIAGQVHEMILDAYDTDASYGDDPRLPRANDGSINYAAIAKAIVRAARD